MSKILYLVILITFYNDLFSQVKDKDFFFGLSDSIVLSQCSEDFCEILFKNKQYSYQRRVDLTDSNIDLRKANNQKYAKKFEKDFHIVSYGDLKVFNKIINVKKDKSHYSGWNLQLIFIEDSLTETYGTIPDFKILEIAYNRFIESSMISEDSVKKILEPKFTLTPHFETNYSIRYDINTNQVIWIASRAKKVKDGRNRFGGQSYLTEDGKVVVESIELDAETGAILKEEIEECEVRIR
jgi:hypothetical protein